MVTRRKSEDMKSSQILEYMLDASATILPEELIDGLGKDLERDKEQLALELGFSQSITATHGLLQWCQSTGSTVHVLLSVLGNLGRSSYIKLISQYMRMNTMQLYVKVEVDENNTEEWCMRSRHTVITRCDCTLVQALSSLLGSDLVYYYDIVGPGNWVKWDTFAKDLKGQQLTLHQHNRPVTCPQLSHLQYSNSDTESKRPVLLPPNIPNDSSSGFYDNTLVKQQEYDPTEMDNLKWHDFSSKLVEGDIQEDSSFLKKNLDSVIPNGPSKTVSYVTEESCSHFQFTMDSHTHMKVPISHENTVLSCCVNKVLPNKMCIEGRDMDSLQKSDIHNLPNLSILQNSFSQKLVNGVTEPQGEVKKNNLSCVTSTSHMNRSVVAKMSTPHSIALLQEDFSVHSAMCVDGSDLAASSLYDQNKNTLFVNVDKVLPEVEYVPLHCIQNIKGQSQQTNDIPSDILPCACGLIGAPPQKRLKESINLPCQQSGQLWQIQQQPPPPQQQNHQQQMEVSLICHTPSQEIESNFSQFCSMPVHRPSVPFQNPPQKMESNCSSSVRRPLALINPPSQETEGNFSQFSSPSVHRPPAPEANEYMVMCLSASNPQPDYLHGPRHSRQSSNASGRSSGCSVSGSPACSQVSSSSGRRNFIPLSNLETRPVPQPFNPAPLNSHMKDQRAESVVHSVAEDGYNIIDNSKVNTSVTFRPGQMPGCLEDELTHLEGWCPTENGDTIQRTMEKYRSHDGCYIIWKSRRYDQFVLTVSHSNELIYLRVEQDQSASYCGTMYYLFKGGFKSGSLLELVNHYRSCGVPHPIQLQTGGKTYQEHVRLLHPISVRLERKERTDTKSK